MAKQNQRFADSRDMYAVHTMFRREFGALPPLIRGVAAHDLARTRIVADHVALVVDLLHVHHQSEDEHCWPKVESRGPQDAASIAELMRSQHEVVAAALEAAEQRTCRWRTSATAADRDALADAIEGLLPPLVEHLDTEEDKMLPLIDRYLTSEEWADVGKKGLGDVPGAKVPVLFGMLLQDASNEQRALFKEAIGTPLFAVMSWLGPIAVRRYRQKVFPPV